MRVAALNSNNDWKFGKGKAQYLVKSDLVRQNLLTRIKSFSGDWFLDTDANIDWLTIMGNKNNEQTILNEIRRVALSTLGVALINSIEVESTGNRTITIRLNYTDIYENTFEELIDV